MSSRSSSAQGLRLSPELHARGLGRDRLRPGASGRCRCWNSASSRSCWAISRRGRNGWRALPGWRRNRARGASCFCPRTPWRSAARTLAAIARVIAERRRWRPRSCTFPASPAPTSGGGGLRRGAGGALSPAAAKAAQAGAVGQPRGLDVALPAAQPRDRLLHGHAQGAGHPRQHGGLRRQPRSRTSKRASTPRSTPWFCSSLMGDMLDTLDKHGLRLGRQPRALRLQRHQRMAGKHRRGAGDGRLRRHRRHARAL